MMSGGGNKHGADGRASLPRGALPPALLKQGRGGTTSSNANIPDGLSRIQNSREERAQNLHPYNNPFHQPYAHLRNLEQSLALLQGPAPAVSQVPWVTSLATHAPSQPLVETSQTTSSSSTAATTATASAPAAEVLKVAAGSTSTASPSPFAARSYNLASQGASFRQPVELLLPPSGAGYGGPRFQQPNYAPPFVPSPGLISNAPMGHPALHPRPWGEYEMGNGVSWTVSSSSSPLNNVHNVSGFGALPYAAAVPHVGFVMGHEMVHPQLQHQQEQQLVAQQQQQLTAQRPQPAAASQSSQASELSAAETTHASRPTSSRMKRNRSRESSDEDGDAPKLLRMDRRLDGEARLVIEFESYGTRGRVLQTFGRERWILPDGLRGSHNAYDQEWRFEIEHGELVEGSMPPIVCVTWRITHVQSDQVTERKETQDEAEKRLSLGWTIATKVFIQAMANRVEKLREQLKNERDPHRIRKLHEAIGILQPKGFTQGPLMFGLRHRCVQEAMHQAE